MRRQIGSQIPSLPLLIPAISIVVGQMPFALQVAQAKSFDSSGLSSGKTQPADAKGPAKPSVEAKKAVKKLFTLEELQIKKIETQIKAINLIIKTERDESKKIDLFLRRAQLQLGVARSMGLKRTSVTAMTPIEKQYLQSAQKTLTGLQSMLKGQNKKLADIHYLLGLIDYEYDNTDAVKKNFYQAIAYSPQHPFVSTMAIVLGELEYDRERFQDAIQIYQKFYKQYTPKEKALADYKTAWSYIGFNDYENARQYFLRIIQNKNDPDFATDSIKDLAFLAVQELDEAKIVSYGNQKLTDAKSRGLFFYYALQQFLAKDKKVKRDLLFAELQKLEMDPVQKARVYYLRVQFERSEVPTIASYQAMLDLNKYLASLKAEDLSKFLMQDGMKLEDDSEAIIKNFIDAYSGKVQKPDSLPQAKLIEAAKNLIAIHLRVFPQSTKKEIIYALWMDACTETKDEATLEYLKNQFFIQRKKTPFDSLYNQAFLKQIVLVDEAYIKNPAPNSKKLAELILQFLKEFPKHAENLKIRKKLAAIYIKEEKYSEALPILEQIQKEEPHVENLNRLLYVKFKLNMYQDVVNNEQATKYNNPEIQDLMRESSLKMAQKSIDDGAFADYEVHIKKFLLSNPSDEKAVVAYQDYFQRILNQQKLGAFVEEWKKMKATLQPKKEFEGVRRQAITLSFILGQPLTEPSLLKSSSNRELQYAIDLYELSHRPIDAAQLKRSLAEVPKDKKTYILKYASMLTPSTTIEVLSHQKSLSNEEKSLLFDAILLDQKHDFSEFIESKNFPSFLQSKLYQQVKSFIPASALPKPKSKYLDQLKTYKVPTPDMAAARHGKMIETLATNLRFLRKKGVQELSKISFSEQNALLTELISLEKRTGEAIMQSPLPANLTPEQQEEYKKGLAELAAEFEKQSAEYATALEGIKKQREEERLVGNKNKILVEDTDDLIKPKSKDMLAQAIKLSKENPLLALLHIDSLFAEGKIGERDYDLIKIHLMMNQDHSSAMRGILGRDLVLQKKQELLDEINAKAKK